MQLVVQYKGILQYQFFLLSSIVLVTLTHYGTALGLSLAVPMDLINTL